MAVYTESGIEVIGPMLDRFEFENNMLNSLKEFTYLSLKNSYLKFINKIQNYLKQ